MIRLHCMDFAGWLKVVLVLSCLTGVFFMGYDMHGD